MRSIAKIVIHCSDSDYSHHDDISVIRDWHVSERHWSDVGYHFFIKKDGSIQYGRPANKSGAHARGHNKDSMGICLSGKDKNKFKAIQLKKACELVKVLMHCYNIDIENVFGHYELDNKKTCPNFDMNNFREKLKGE